MATPTKFRAEVIKIDRYSDDVSTFEFRCLMRRPRYRAGQFIHLTLEPFDPAMHWPESRVFTIANGPSNKELIRLSISAKGAYTRRIIRELDVGSQVWMKGPYGEFIVKTEAQRDIALIAGGTGISPFVGFMEDVLTSGLEGQVHLHYGARTTELLSFKEISDSCTRLFNHFRCNYYAEQEAREDVVRGQIDIDAVCSDLEDVANTIFYLCGPPSMIKAFAEKLKNTYKVGHDRIRIDDWGESGS